VTLRLAPSLPKFAVDSELPNVVSANTDTLKPSWVALNADRHEPKFDIPSTLKLLPNLVTSETEMVDQNNPASFTDAFPSINTFSPTEIHEWK
jgi:hypothetical protein